MRVYVPATIELHESVAGPELVTMLGVMALHDRLAGTVSVRLTVPVKPYEDCTLTVKVAESPAWIVRLFAEMEKSRTVIATISKWKSEPLVPVMLIL